MWRAEWSQHVKRQCLGQDGDSAFSDQLEARYQVKVVQQNELGRLKKRIQGRDINS